MATVDLQFSVSEMDLVERYYDVLIEISYYRISKEVFSAPHQSWCDEEKHW